MIQVHKNYTILTNRVLVVYIILFSFNSILSSQELYGYENSLKYANYLYSTKQFKDAVIEYERVVFLNPDDSLSKLNLIKAYRFNGNYQVATDRLQSFYPNSVSEMSPVFAREYIINQVLANNYDNVNSALDSLKNLDSSEVLNYRYGLFLLENRWKDAESFRESNSAISKNDLFNSLYEIEKKGISTRYKKGLYSSIMSAAIPGSGKVYSGYWKDGIYSFLYVTALSYLTYYTYQRNGLSINTYFVGAIAFSFHLANIYGSFKSAKKHNLKVNSLYSDEIRRVLIKDY